MERKNGHLTKEDRIRIETLLEADFGETEIARSLGRDRRTIEREIQRNAGKRGYDANEADRLAVARRSKPRHRKFTRDVSLHVRRCLRKKHSPEQISEAMEDVVGTNLHVHSIVQEPLWQCLECSRCTGDVQCPQGTSSEGA
jgi:IS30 family transposase